MPRIARSRLSWLAPLAITLALSGPLTGGSALGAPAAPATGCQTTVGGPLHHSTVWTAAKSPYCVTSSIYVSPGITLTVQAGVDVLFNSALSVLVDGTMIARGSATQPVTFTSIASQVPGAWNGLVLSAQATPTRYNKAGHYAGGSGFLHAVILYAGGGSANAALELDAPVLVDHSTIENSAAIGLYEPVGGARVTHDTISSNTSNCQGINGSGVSVGSGSTITHSAITRNAANCGGYGAGVFADTGSTIANNMVSSNTGCGYGIGIDANSHSNIANNIITNNTDTCGDYGGGIYSAGSDTITGNTIAGNTFSSGGYGGGIYSNGSDTIEGNTITGNQAENGGGIYSSGGDTIVGVTVTNNTASGYGGGIYLESGSTISHTLIAYNQMTQSGGLGAGLYCSCDSTDSLQTMSVISNTAPGNQTAAGLDVYGHPLLRDNSLCGNTPYDLGDRNAFSSSSTLDATKNYWGTTQSGVIQNHIYDFFKNGSLERVVYIPYLTSPDPLTQPCP